LAEKTFKIAPGSGGANQIEGRHALSGAEMLAVSRLCGHGCR